MKKGDYILLTLGDDEDDYGIPNVQQYDGHIYQITDINEGDGIRLGEFNLWKDHEWWFKFDWCRMIVPPDSKDSNTKQGTFND